ncbi:hypothetical protein DLAC_03306 [Tieghemostelium lacteum]|uniref:Uncharacterized protein n=1 Tax=Tieghemostelium lacteum TaxID=361077 RepID=A0A152A231_TIELA|nr:hypothetical protein DLAC_03306 [Tieghemostelium lacteum]|eukprot:KYR00155.1 hypothetical protein DLAC_03306 [Tieghemostelium lacteum]
MKSILIVLLVFIALIGFIMAQNEIKCNEDYFNRAKYLEDRLKENHDYEAYERDLFTINAVLQSCLGSN